MPTEVIPVNCLAALPVKRKPKAKLPAGAWDCHAHVFGPVDQFPYIDVIKYTPPEAHLAQYLDLLDTFGFGNGVLVQPSTYAFDRACLLDGIARSAGRLKGVAYLAPHELTHLHIADLHERGLRGVRINAALPSFNSELLASTANAIAEFNWHVSLQVKNIDQVAELAGSLIQQPVPIIIEAMGKMPADANEASPGFISLLRLLESAKVYVKLSHVYKVSRTGPPYEDALWVARRLVKANSDAVIYGSDWPHPDVHPMPYDEDLLDLVLEWAPSTQMQEKIWSTNPARLYSF
jgi:predicted TIM-barrel fold metal-dependent hydrolase